MAYAAFFTWAGEALTYWLALRFFFPATPEHPSGLLNPEPWTRYSGTMALAAATVLLLSAWFTRDRIPYLPRPGPDTPRFSALEFARDIGRAMTNINYVWLLVGYFFLSLTNGLRDGLWIYTATFYWELSSERQSWFVIGSFAGFLFSFLFAARLNARFDKKATILGAGLIYCIGPSVPFLLGLAGVLTPQTPGLLPFLIAWTFFTHAPISVMTISVMSALADIADENELKHGVRQEGVLYSTRALFAKVDQAIGAALAGAVLTLIAFPVKATPGEVPEGVLRNLAIAYALSAVPGLVALVFYGRYRINRDSHAATRAALDRRTA
jgi:Na+/melibiose symporter-like transporter